MLSWPPPVRVFVHTQPTDMRRSFDRLAWLAQEVLHQDPFSGHLFGRRSEKLDPSQQVLFDLLDQALQERQAASPPPVPKAPAVPASRHGRVPLPKHLPRERIEWYPSQEALVCPGCGQPKERMGEEISEQLDYAQGRWQALRRSTQDGILSIDNNLAERTLRLVAVGRKNWLFVGHDNGGHRAAIIYSLVAGCRLCGIDPFAYLCDMLERINTHPASRLVELLPRNGKSSRP